MNQLTTGSLLDNPYVIDIIQSSNSIQSASGTNSLESTIITLQEQIAALQAQVAALQARVSALDGGGS